MNEPKPLAGVDVLVLCGGKGTRLKSELPDVPKALAPIEGRTFLDLVFEYLARHGVERTVLCIGVGRDQIAAHIARRPPAFPIELSTEVAPLGTAGALARALPRCHGDLVLVMNGDSLCPVDLGAMVAFHRGKQADFTIAVSPPTPTGDCGDISADGSGRIFAFREKPTGGSAGERNAGIYVFSRAFLQREFRVSRGSLEHELFTRADAFKAYVFRQSFDFVDIGTPERYRRAPERLRALGLLPRQGSARELRG